MAKEITLEKLASIPSYSFITPNHNKDKVGFYWNKTKSQEFYIIDPKTMEYEQITDGELPKAIRAGFIWLKDDIHITYTRDVDGNEQHNIFLYNTETKESVQLTDTPKAQEYPVDISPDGKKLLFASNRHDQMNLFIMDLETKEVTQLTAFDKPVWGLAEWAENGWIYFSYNDTYNIKNNDVWVIKQDGSEIKKLFSVSEDSNDSFGSISSDGKLMSIETDHSGLTRAGVYNLETDEISWLGDGKYEEAPAKFSSDNKKLIVVRVNEAELYPIIYDIKTGEAKVLSFKGLTYYTRFVLDDNYLIYMRMDSKTPVFLARYDMANDKEEIMIPPQTDLTAEDFYEQQYIKYPTFDGREIAATVYTPKLEPGKKYPALVNVHGGPTGQYFQMFDMFSQVFAHEGFVILNPNIRGSTGYGKEFMELNLKDWGGGDGKDVVYAKKYLETLDYVDTNKIGVFGGSYGGYMTFIQLTKYADAGWNAGSAWIGISDLKTMYDKSKPHFQYFLIQHLGSYEENEEVWKKGSAMTFVDSIYAPIQMIHGVNDPRCPVEESRQFRDKLLEMGWKEGTEGEKTYEYVEFTDEGHGAFSDIGMRIRTFKLFIDFFKRRLL
ncbi:MAG: S9 family peptidase [Candidatus Heimdallarchaeota archaeon]|nr:S9 family peptidase [Candidatus Heimdallarchaeota archaeon]